MAVLLSGCASQPWPFGNGGNAPEPRTVRESAPPPPPPPAAVPPVEPRALFDGEGNDASKDSGLSEPIIERGQGSRIGEPLSTATASVGRDEAAAITLNVVDTDIRDVVRLVLEDGLGASYAIDPAVSGNITVRTSTPVPAEDVIGILSSVLSLNGAALIDEGDFFKIVPKEKALSAGGRPQAAARLAGRPGSGIQVVPLRFADGIQLAELLQPFVANEGAVQLDPTRNILLLIGSPQQVATMSDLIAMFDVDWMAGMSFGLYPLDEATPSELAEELDQIFRDPETGSAPGSLRFVPIDRLSALLTISTEPSYLDRAQSWINRLDKAGEGDGQQIFVYPVQNGRATDLASVLGELFDIRSAAIGEPSLLAPGLDPIEIGPSGPTSGGEVDLGDESAGLDNERGFERDSRRSGSSAFPDGTGAGQRTLTNGRREDGTRIVADETSNTLLVRATSKEYKKILSALGELDKQPLQVLLEATIFEVTLTNELSYGIQWFLGSGRSGVALSDFSDRSVGDTFPIGFTGLLSSGDVRIAIDALDEITDVNVVSSPQVLVLDNQTALLQVGDEVPIVTQSAEGIDTGDDRIVNTVEQRQTGVILNVTPRVNASGLVVLDIEQEVSNVVRTTSSGIDSPTIAQRRIGTSVAVASAQTVVLGGLIQDNAEDINTGVPLLKDIPGLGLLFGQTTQITNRTELLVLITPKVLTNQSEAVEATNELRRRLRSLEPLQAKIENLKREVAADGPETTAEDVVAFKVAEDSEVASNRVYVVQLGSVPAEEDAWDLWA